MPIPSLIDATDIRTVPLRTLHNGFVSPCSFAVPPPLYSGGHRAISPASRTIVVNMLHIICETLCRTAEPIEPVSPLLKELYDRKQRLMETIMPLINPDCYTICLYSAFGHSKGRQPQHWQKSREKRTSKKIGKYCRGRKRDNSEMKWEREWEKAWD